MKKIFLYSFIVLLLTQTVAAQEVKHWSFNDCVSYALQNNITIKRQELAVKTSKNDYIQSVAELGPNFNVGGEFNYNSGNTFNYSEAKYVNSDYESSSAGLSSSMTLFRGLRNVNTMRQNKLNLQMALEDVEKAKNDVVLNLAAGYLQILFNKELVKLAEEQIKVTSLQVEKTKRQVDVGALAKGELLDIKAQLASEKVTLANAKNDLTNSYIVLLQLLKLDSLEGFDIASPELADFSNEETIPDMFALYNQAVVSLPEVKRAQYNVKSAKRGMDIAYSYISPSLTASFQYYTRYESTQTPPEGYEGEYILLDQFKDRGFNILSFSLSIPIYNKLDGYRRISNAKINYKDAQLNFEQQKQNVLTRVQEAYSNVVGAIENYNASKEALDAREEAFNYAEERFNVGMVSSVDYNIAKNNYTKAQSDYLQAKYQYVFRTKILDFYNGELITIE